MADERKKIIIEEINYWKEHRLLPKEQCNFLLALYTQGEGKNSKHRKYNRILHIYLVLLIVLLPLSMMVTYFTKLLLTIKIGLLILFLLFALFSFVLFKHHQFTYTPLALLTALILLLYITVYMTKDVATHPLILPLVILSNFSLWMILGKYQRMKILQVMGIIALIFTCLYIIFQFT